MAIVTDVIEGVIDSTLWYHYDLAGDVLYLRFADARDEPTVAEETEDGFLLLRRERDDTAVGLTVLHWWRRFGTGERPDSLSALTRTIEPWAARLAA